MTVHVPGVSVRVTQDQWDRMSADYTPRHRLKGCWYLLKAALRYLVAPEKTEDEVYRILFLRTAARSRNPWCDQALALKASGVTE